MDRRLIALVLSAGLLPVAACTHNSDRSTTVTTAAPATTAVPAKSGGEAKAATTATKAGKKTWTAIVGGQEVPAPDMAMGDDATLARIIDEGVNRNQVMEHFRYLTQEIGPRLTGSDRALRANEWCRDQYAQWGLSNPHLESWGDIPVGFNRGPSTGRIVTSERARPERTAPSQRGGPSDRNANRPADTAHAGDAAAPAASPATGTNPGTPTSSPTAAATPAAGDRQPAGTPPALTAASQQTWRPVRELQFTTLAWTRGTDGPVRGTVIRMPQDEEDWNDVKDQLKGAWILIPSPSGRGVGDVRQGVSGQYQARATARKKLADGAKMEDLKVFERVACSPVAGFISSSRDERVWTGAVQGWRNLKPDTIAPEVHVTVKMSDYDYINSRLADGEPVTAEFNLQHNFKSGPVPVFNTIAEIPGTEKPDEIVIVSAHLDSWDGPGSQGATDNGTGTVVTLEAARILMAAKAKPKRTIRFIHWTGEEQGLLGSAGYAKAHAAEMDKISAVFVDDGGTNSQGGLVCVESMRDMLAAATAPVNGLFKDSADGKPLNVNIRVQQRMPLGGGSDHSTFNRIGVPGFFWDEVGRADYGYGWHTQNDKMDLGVPEYLKQSATCTAITAYRLACADTMLPRAPKPEPRPETPRTSENSPAGEQRTSGAPRADGAAAPSGAAPARRAE